MIFRFFRFLPNQKSIMRLLEVKGDLFSSSDCLAHCVSEDLEMGKGIATSFRDKFGQVDVLKSQKRKPGQVAYISVSGRYIFYLITKQKYFEKPKYSTLYESLVELRDLCIKYGITDVSVPKIGCGLDKLDWNMVKMYLNSIFKDTPIAITVYSI